jgi:hypothetical protein
MYAKGKAIVVRGCRGPQDCETVAAPTFSKHLAHKEVGNKVVIPLAAPQSSPYIIQD